MRPQALDAPAPKEPWQAMALEKLLGLLTTRAGMDLVSLAVAVGAQHSTAAALQHFSGAGWDLRRSIAPQPPPEVATARAAAAAGGGDDVSISSGGRRNSISSAVSAAETETSSRVVTQLLSWAATPQVDMQGAAHTQHAQCGGDAVQTFNPSTGPKIKQHCNLLPT